MEELVKARALKRAERVEARSIEAEKRKETVRLHVPLVPFAWHRPNATKTSSHVTHDLGKHPLPHRRLLQSRRRVRGRHPNSWSEHPIFVKLGRSMAQTRGVSLLLFIAQVLHVGLYHEMSQGK